MAENGQKPHFLVNPYSDPVIVKIDGRANYLNCAPLSEFFNTMIHGQERRRFLVDFRECAAMDSTFLGLLAGAALDLRKARPPGELILSRLGERNLELVRNLGLHRLAVVDAEGRYCRLNGTPKEIEMTGQVDGEGPASQETILRAHENLCEIDHTNRAKFQDVLAFLRNQVDNT